MKRRAIGDIARGGGLSEAIREVQETGEPIVITKGNESPAILFPCTVEFERLITRLQGFAGVLKSLQRGGYDAEAMEFLVSNAVIGMAADVFLAQVGKEDVVKALRNGVTERFASFAKNHAEGSALVETNTSAAVMGGDKGRRRKSAAPPKTKRNPPRKRKTP